MPPVTMSGMPIDAPPVDVVSKRVTTSGAATATPSIASIWLTRLVSIGVEKPKPPLALSLTTILSA